MFTDASNYKVWIFAALISALIAYYYAASLQSEYIHGVDEKLYTTALMAKSTLPDDYHDSLYDKSSLSAADYLKIIDRNNQICKVTGIQYLWSNLILDDAIVFTSSTSTSKDVANGDHALLFDQHSDPASFNDVLYSDEPVYSTFTNAVSYTHLTLPTIYSV